MDVERKLYIGVVEENIDPRKQGRIKVRVQTLYHEMSVDDIPWAAPFGSLAGKSFEVPAIGKLVNVMFFQNDLYDPYYMYSENYNINLQNKLNNLSNDEYINFVSLLFDERTQIYSSDSNLTLDYLYNKITIDNTSINLELKDNNGKVNIGCNEGTQKAVLGTNFFEWMDRFVEEIRNPFSMVDSHGAPISKPHIMKLCMEYKAKRKDFVSNNVNIVDNWDIQNIERTPETDNRKNDVDLVLSDTDQSELNAKIQAQNDDACKKMKEALPTDKTSADPNNPPLDGADKVDPNRFGNTLPALGIVTKKFQVDNSDGIDVTTVDKKTKLLCVYDGIVIATGDPTKTNNFLRIKHKNEITTGYSYIQTKLKKDDKVKLGDEIGTTEDGKYFFTVTSQANNYVDPESYFNFGDTKITTNNQYQGQDYKVNSTSTDCSLKVVSKSDNIYSPPGEALKTNPDMTAGFPIIKYFLPESQYGVKKTPKRQIFLHGTAGAPNAAKGAIDWWNSNSDKVATHYVLNANGEIWQAIPEEYFGWHLGIQPSFLRTGLNGDGPTISMPKGAWKLSQESFGIEICNWNWIKNANGKFYNYVNSVVPADQVYTFDYKFRGFYDHNKYTSAQLASLRQLLTYLCDKYGIPKTYHENMWEVNADALNGTPGIWSHTSVRSDKSDASPQAGLIGILKSL